MKRWLKTSCLLILTALLQSATASAQTSDCLIDQTLPSFEEKMGYELGTAQDGTVFPPAEKIAFNQVAAVLPPFYRRMNVLQRFERIPDGYVLEGGAVGQYTVHGMQFGGMRRVHGEIVLAQRELKTINGRFAGEFHWNIIHEMSHAVDFDHDTFSHTDSWKNLSTWGPEGTGTSKNFVTWYAPTSPDEDFAESMTAFLLDPDHLLAVAPTKFEIISKQFYQGRRYDLKSLNTYYESLLQGLQPAARAAKIRELRRTDYYACQLLNF